MKCTVGKIFTPAALNLRLQETDLFLLLGDFAEKIKAEEEKDGEVIDKENKSLNKVSVASRI